MVHTERPQPDDWPHYLMSQGELIPQPVSSEQGLKVYANTNGQGEVLSFTVTVPDSSSPAVIYCDVVRYILPMQRRMYYSRMGNQNESVGSRASDSC